MEALNIKGYTTNLQKNEDINEHIYESFLSYIDVKPKSVETYKKALRQFFQYMINNNISTPTRSDILDYRNYLKEKNKPNTVQLYMTVIRLFFRWTSQENIYLNVADNIKGATISREFKKDYLTSSQVKKILDGIDRDSIIGLRDYAIISLMTTGGLRNIEISRADVRDIRVLGNDTVLFIQGKGKEEKAEYVKITSPVEVVLRDYLLTRDFLEDKQPLFSSTSNNSFGGRLSTRSISKIVKTRFMNAGYNSDRLTAHSLRHTAVTLSLLGGMSLQDVQQFARHSKIDTTQVYAHNLDRAKNKCEETIAKALFE